MAYTSNVPAVNTVANQTRKPIADNFALLAPWGNGYGDFTQQTVAPTITGNDIGMYNLNSTFTSIPAMFLSNAAGKISEFSTYQKGAYAGSNQAWTQLPSGVIIKWGDISTTVLGTNTVTFNPAYPAFTSAYQLIVNTQRGGASTDPNQALYSSNTSLTTFNVYCYLRTGTGTITNTPFSWIAIGV